MSYPLIQVPSAFQQLATTVQAIQEQRRQRQMGALRSLLTQTQLEESQAGIANTRSQILTREAETPSVIAGRESQTRARNAETARAQRQDDALDALMRGLDPSMAPDTSQSARRVFEALPIPGVEVGTKRRPLKPGGAQPRTAQPASGLPQPAAEAGERGNLGRALRAALALDDRVPANVANFIFEHLANNGAPEGIPAETMRLLFSGARAGAGVLSFGKIGRLVGVPEEALRAAGIDPNTVLPRTPPFFMTVGGQQSVEQTNLARTIQRLESQVTRADGILQTYLAEERVKLLTPGERVLGNRGAQAIADQAREQRAQNLARQRLQRRIPSYDQMRTQLQEATRRLVSMSVGTTITGAQPEPEDELDAAIRGVIRP